MTLAVVEPLRVENTISVGGVRHRLALGVQWRDAVSGLNIGSGWFSELEAIGARPLRQPFDVHPRGGHALRLGGRLATLLAAGAADKVANPPATVEADQTNFVLRAYGRLDPQIDRYESGNDPRRCVPRRLSLTPVQQGGIPTDKADNVRSAWIWPGCNYPLPSKVTALRGRVRRNPSKKPVPWTRVVVTRPGPGPADFVTEDKLAFAHGDDRGEFLVLLGPGAVPGGVVLPPDIKLHIWVFLPPAAPLDPTDPLASLPLEVAGQNPISDVLRGIATPAGYVRQNAVDETVVPGRLQIIDEAKLLF